MGKKLWILAALVTLILEWALDRHGYFQFDSILGFYGILGLISVIGFGFIARLLSGILIDSKEVDG